MDWFREMKWSFLKKKVITAAKQKLTKSPYDLYHTITHHKAVFENCKKIIRDERLTVDTDFLEIACFWHDVFKGNENEERLLNNELKNLGLSQNILDTVLKIISEHSFGKEQTLEESKLLYDADKIELVSIPRWKAVFDAYDSGEVDVAARDKYVKEWNRRMPLIENHLHYPSSNLTFSNRLSEFKMWLKEINRLDNNGNFISEI